MLLNSIPEFKNGAFSHGPEVIKSLFLAVVKLHECRGNIYGFHVDEEVA